jgi:hypothetical protein
MRDATVALGADPAQINPVIPAELVIDHSVIADVFGTPDAFARNVEIEYGRNAERYRFLKWGQGSLRNFAVVPPGTGIMHQVNVEYLSRVVMAGVSAGSRPRPPCSASPCRCCSRRSSASGCTAPYRRAPPRPTSSSRSPS